MQVSTLLCVGFTLTFCLPVVRAHAAEGPTKTIWDIQQEVTKTDARKASKDVAASFARIANYSKWMDETQRFKIEAKYLDDGEKNEQQQVFLQKRDGSKVWVPVNRLHKLTQLHLKNVIRRKEALLEVYASLKSVGAENILAREQKKAAAKRIIDSRNAAAQALIDKKQAAEREVRVEIALSVTAYASGHGVIDRNRFAKAFEGLLIISDAYERGDMSTVKTISESITNRSYGSYAQRLLDNTKMGSWKRSDKSLRDIWKAAIIANLIE